MQTCLLNFHSVFANAFLTLNNLLVATSISKPCAHVVFSDLGLTWCAYVRQEETYQTLIIVGTMDEI